jgi:hypothetical protein
VVVVDRQARASFLLGDAAVTAAEGVLLPYQITESRPHQ